MVLPRVLTAQAADETALGLSADPVSRTYWVFTQGSIIEVITRSEDRDVWRAKLERQEFTEALKFTRVSVCAHFTHKPD